MAKKFNRKLFLNTNKFQKRLILPIIIACLIAGTMTILCLEYYLATLTSTGIIVFGYNIRTLEFGIPFLLGSVGLILAFIIFWVFYTSNKILGPYTRIIREMDDMISGKKQDAFSTRQGDEMFEEILRRVNKLLGK